MTRHDRRPAGRHWAGAVAALVVLAGATLWPAAPAAATRGQRVGLPGYCPDANGVTVVVDFQELGGSTIVRCAVGDQPTGHAALVNAGFSVTGTARWGEAFICRIEGKPPPDAEPCIDTPPASAHWSYWYAPHGGAWTYSQMGAMSRKPLLGGFEGWSFSMNRTAGDSPPPRVAPVRPAPTQAQEPPSQGTRVTPPPTPPRATGTPAAPKDRPDTPSGAAHHETGPPAPTAGLPTPTAPLTPSPTVLPRRSPSTQVAATPHGTSGEWTGELAGSATPSETHGGPVATVLGAALLAAVTGAAILVARRRKRPE